MNRDYRPFSSHNLRSVLKGLMAVLRDRGVRARWHHRTSRNHFMALVGGDGDLEVHAFLGRQRIPRIGRILMLQAVCPPFISPELAPKVAFFCDRANETLYGSKLYLHWASGDPTVLQLIVERGCLVGGGNLFRIADEFDLLVAEYFLAEQKLEDVIGEEDPISQARQVGLFDRPMAETC